MINTSDLQMKPVSRLTEILDAICDAQSFGLFSAVANEGQSSDTLVDRLNISRKQYYTRIQKLVKTGLVKRKSGKYTLTFFGQVVYEAQLMLRKVVENRAKLGAVESVTSINETPMTDSLIVMDGVMITQR